MTSFEVKSIGRVTSPLTELASAPLQPDKRAPEAWLVFEPEMLEGLYDTPQPIEWRLVVSPVATVILQAPN